MAKKVAFYGVTAAVCLVFSYVETLLPLGFIAPGIKIGLANGVALLLILKKDIKGAFLVNIITEFVVCKPVCACFFANGRSFVYFCYVVCFKNRQIRRNWV